MKKFLDENFLLHSRTAEKLYHDHAGSMPIIDYHNHLSPQEIAQNKTFRNISEAWLAGDHYKWRAMRANGISEEYITGNTSPYEKFEKWAETVPATLGNPLYHWTHLELKNPLGIEAMLSPATCKVIYDKASSRLADLPVQKMLSHFNVKLLCTTDDPIDNLQFHQQLRKGNQAVRILPTFRPDKAMAIELGPAYNKYLNSFAEVTNKNIDTWDHFREALRMRHDFFAQHGCKLSDHGLETFYAEEFEESEIARIFINVRSGKAISPGDVLKFKSACLVEFATLDAEKNWTQQFHVGAIRNNNTRLMQRVGADCGADSIGDFHLANDMSRFLNRMNNIGRLPKTIVYNLNPAYNEVVATMLGNFQDGSVAGKMQFGSAWWFLDQKDGIESQLKVLSTMGLLGRFVGMLTDSRSFLSFSRHEYFRRILCNFLGKQVENGELPGDLALLGKTIQDICYNNAERYFQF